MRDTPRHPWGLVQIGNCGSLLKTPEGWRLLTHGVEPMRSYCSGAMLLDLNDPLKVIGVGSPGLGLAAFLFFVLGRMDADRGAGRHAPLGGDAPLGRREER